MKKLRVWTLVIPATVLLTLLVGSTAPAADNLALHKPYELSPPGNYLLTL